MTENSVGVMRGVFDPSHKGHLEAAISAFRALSLSKLYVTVKFIGEKDPSASLKQRIDMMAIQTADCGMPIEIVKQEVRGHITELIELEKKHGVRPINICGSDKVVRELAVYGKSGDVFGMVCRPDFPSKERALRKAEEMGIHLVEINPPLCTSSTFVRNLMLQNQPIWPELDPHVRTYIERNNLYIPNDWLAVREEFLAGWFRFIDKLIPDFPSLRLWEVPEPSFNPIQNREAWWEKYLRTIIKSRALEGQELVEFVTVAENYQEFVSTIRKVALE